MSGVTDQEPSDQVPPQYAPPPYAPPPQWGQQQDQQQPWGQPQWGQQQQWGQPQQWQNPPPGYGWPPPLAPPRRRFGIKRIALIAIVAIAASGVYAYEHSKSSNVAAVSAVTCNPANLTSCLIAIPSSASHYIDSWGASTTPTKTDYLKWAYDLDPTSQQIASDNLTSAGLQGIAHTAWKGTDGNGIDLTLLKFSGVQGAHSRALELLGSEILAGDPVAVPDGLPGSAYSSATANTNGDIDTQYSVNVGDLVLQVHYYSSGSYSPADFSAWLSAEYKSLTTAPKVAPSPQPTSTTQSVTCASSLPSCLLDAPSGSTGWGNSWGDSTMPTAAQYAAQMFNDSGWRTIIAARLKTAGLAGIAHRAWVTSNGAEVDDIVLSFNTANGALAWYKNDAYSNSGTAFTVPGQQNVSGTYDPKPNSDGNVSAEVFGVSGTTVMELFAWSPQSFDKARTVTWASQQLTRIGATSKTQTVAVPPIPAPSADGGGANGSSSSCSAAQGCLMAAPSGSMPWSDSDYDKTTTATVQQ